MMTTWRVLHLSGLLAVNPGAQDLHAPVGPLTPCAEGQELLDPVLEHKELPTHWAFWTVCDTYVGVPIVGFLVTIDGQTANHTILRSSGCTKADQELLCWMKSWRYQPAFCGEEPVGYRTTFSINWHPGSELHQDPFQEAATPEVELNQLRPDLIEAVPGTCAAADHQLWQKLLDAALIKTEVGRSMIEQTAAEPPSEPIGRLAEILLEEWDLPGDAEDLRQPRIVYSPEPDLSDLWDDGLALEHLNVVVTGLVTSSGVVEAPAISTSVGAPEVDQRCLEVFSGWCYRPARGDCGYVRKEAGAVCHINPREVEESIAKARQEMEDARRELEEEVRRQREELPRREGRLPGGKVRELAREEMEEALQLCRTAPRRFVEAEVVLDTKGDIQSVELRTGSGEEGCDRAVIGALQASSWMSCQDLGEAPPCRVSYALSLGSPLQPARAG